MSILFNTSTPVFADDDEYYTFSDYESMIAYRYWASYGLTADKTLTHTQEYTTTGIVSTNGSVTISGSVNGNEVVNLSNLQTFSGTHTSGYNVYYDPGATFEIHVHDDTGANPITLACRALDPKQISTDGTQKDFEYSNLRCDGSDNTVYELGYYTNYQGGGSGLNHIMQFISIDQTQTGYEDYGAVSAATVTGFIPDHATASITITETVNESGNISLAGTVNYKTTTVNRNRLLYTYPIMNGTINSNPSTGHVINMSTNRDSDYTFVVAFISNKQSASSLVNSWINGYYAYESGQWVGHVSNDNTSWAHSVYAGNIPDVGYLGVYEFYGSEFTEGQDIQIMWSTSYASNAGILPLYAGYKTRMSDNMYRFLYHGDRTIDAINNAANTISSKLDKSNQLVESGNTSSQSAVTGNNAAKDQFVQSSSTYNQMEDNQVEEFNDHVGGISTNTTNGILSNSKFLATANWVTAQFQRLVLNTPFELVIIFSLTLGLALVFIKKVE